MMSAAFPVVAFAVYRAGIYRLLSMLLAIQRTEGDEPFADLCSDHADAEITPLLIQIAAISRQHLLFLALQDPARYDSISSSICGDFFAADKGDRKLSFKAACNHNHIVHAHNITLYNSDNEDMKDAPDRENVKILCFPNAQDGIAEMRATNLDFEKYLKICITLSNILKEITP